MSYLRGKYYAYVCGDTSDNELIALHSPKQSHCCDDGAKHHAILLPMRVFDQLVVMRMAQLARDGLLKKAVQKVVRQGSHNFGATELLELCGFDPLGTWSDEWAVKVKRHRKTCKKPRTCGSPGFHRYHRLHRQAKP